MTREKIEKVAQEYADIHWDGDFSNLASRCSFISGARWRINSVWRKPTPYGEELKRDAEVIAKTKRGYRFGKFDVVGTFHEYIAFVNTSSLEYSLSDVLEYAYLSDLIPERNEEWNDSTGID